jgi:hypothetical protein
MNTNEFKYWLEGFIEGRDTLSETELEIVREKLSQLTSESVSLSMTPPIFTQTTTNDTFNN